MSSIEPLFLIFVNLNAPFVFAPKAYYLALEIGNYSQPVSEAGKQFVRRSAGIRIRASAIKQ